MVKEMSRVHINNVNSVHFISVNFHVIMVKMHISYVNVHMNVNMCTAIGPTNCVGSWASIDPSFNIKHFWSTRGHGLKFTRK